MGTGYSESLFLLLAVGAFLLVETDHPVLAGLVGAYAAGHYRLPSVAEMERVIVADQELYTGHVLDRPRHTQQLDYFIYEHDMRTREIPTGRARAQAEGAPVLAGRT